MTNDHILLAVCLIAGATVTVLGHWRTKYGTWGRVWCRVVHRHTSGWRTGSDSYGTSRRCNSCKRGWHVTH